MIKLDLTEVMEVLQDALERTQALHGRDVPQPEKGKNRAAVIAEINKSLVGTSHLCDKARVLLLDEYHAVRGFYDAEPRQ